MTKPTNSPTTAWESVARFERWADEYQREGNLSAQAVAIEAAREFRKIAEREALVQELKEALRDSPCYCEVADGYGDAVTCDRCALLAKMEGR